MRNDGDDANADPAEHRPQTSPAIDVDAASETLSDESVHDTTSRIHQDVPPRGLNRILVDQAPTA